MIAGSVGAVAPPLLARHCNQFLQLFGGYEIVKVQQPARTVKLTGVETRARCTLRHMGLALLITCVAPVDHAGISCRAVLDEHDRLPLLDGQGAPEGTTRLATPGGRARSAAIPGSVVFGVRLTVADMALCAESRARRVSSLDTPLDTPPPGGSPPDSLMRFKIPSVVDVVIAPD
eukprot:5489647-Prymnesium_polylepis.1